MIKFAPGGIRFRSRLRPHHQVLRQAVSAIEQPFSLPAAAVAHQRLRSLPLPHRFPPGRNGRIQRPPRHPAAVVFHTAAHRGSALSRWVPPGRIHAPVSCEERRIDSDARFHGFGSTRAVKRALHGKYQNRRRSGDTPPERDSLDVIAIGHEDEGFHSINFDQNDRLASGTRTLGVTMAHSWRDSVV